jgi:Uncharacterised nucleotidyltransferase
MATQAQTFYRQVLQTLAASEIPFLVGGGYAAREITGIHRNIKDLDVFVVRRNLDPVLACLEEAGYRVEVPFSHWLAKAHSGRNFVDIIFNAGNGFCPVDQVWFDYSSIATVMGEQVRLCPPEETIWQKAFVMERERYDGADVAHLLRACGRDLDWWRLIDRFGANWRVLFGHLVLFGYIYPDDRELIPAWVMTLLMQQLQRDRDPAVPPAHVCWGTLLSRKQFQADTEEWGYADPRLPPFGVMSAEQLADWSAGT